MWQVIPIGIWSKQLEVVASVWNKHTPVQMSPTFSFLLTATFRTFARKWSRIYTNFVLFTHRGEATEGKTWLGLPLHTQSRGKAQNQNEDKERRFHLACMVRKRIENIKMYCKQHTEQIYLHMHANQHYKRQRHTKLMHD